MLEDFITLMQMQSGILKVESFIIDYDLGILLQDKLESYFKVLQPRRLVFVNSLVLWLSFDITLYGVEELIINDFHRI